MSASNVTGISKSPFASDVAVKLLNAVPFQIFASKVDVEFPVPTIHEPFTLTIARPIKLIVLEPQKED